MDDDNRSDGWESARSRYSKRRHSGDRADPWGRRFVVAMSILLAVVIVYPWYERWVDDFITARFLEALGEQLAETEEDLQQQVQEQAAKAAKKSRLEQLRLRLARVNVKGVTSGPAGPIAIVDLGSASLSESAWTICRQARVWLNADLTGTSLKVQRYRGSLPALDAGVVDCR